MGFQDAKSLGQKVFTNQELRAIAQAINKQEVKQEKK